MRKILFAAILTTVSFFSMLHAQNSQGNVYVATNGSDSNPGTLAEPFATIQHAVNVMNPGDICYIRGGTYREEVDLYGVAGELGAPITLIPYQDEEVILSGTVPITSNWTQHSGNIYKTTLSEDIWQLFVDGKMMTLARFPNALAFSDLMWDRHKARRMKSPSQSTNGQVVDDPTSGATATLAGAGLSFNNCVGVFNFGNFSSSAGIVANHTAGTDHFDYSPSTVQYRQTQGYFFEGGINDAELTMVDMAEEWAYDESTKTLYLWADDGLNPTGRTIEGKNQTNFFTGNPATKNITIDGLDFFGTAFYFYSSDYITIQNCVFNYYSYSKRALGSTLPSGSAFFEGRSDDFCSQIKVYNCEFNYSSGMGLRGEKIDVGCIENNLFYQNSYACATDGSVPSPSTVMMLRCRDLLFRRNTIHTSGAAQAVKLGERDGRPWTSEYNYFTACGLQQTDGAAHYSYQAAATESVARYNWFYGNSARDFRWDGPNDPVVTGVHANVYRTVAMDTGRKEENIDGDGYRLKGDFHEIYNNLGINERSTLNVAVDKGGNASTITRNNAADYFTDDPIPGTASNNFIGQYEPKILIDLLIDPYNFDFRPRADAAELINQGLTVSCSVDGQTIDVTNGFIGIAPDIGAYEYGDTVYWIPGRQSIMASFPIPADGADSLPKNSDLMFLFGSMSKQADIYLGKDYTELSNADKTSPTYLTTKTISNIVAELELDANTTYYWRVDAIDSLKSEITKGDVWQFTTGNNELPTGGINNGEGPLEKPSMLKAIPVSMSEIELHWSDNSHNEIGFAVERKVEDGRYEELVKLPTNISSYTDEGLSAYTTYVYRIYAYNNDGDSDYSNESSATTNEILRYEPTEDTYVKGGDSEHMNFGSASVLEAKAISNESLHRRTMLKFDLRNEKLVSDDIALAKLRLYANRAVDCTIAASEINDNWEEQVVTWATAPVSGETIATTGISSLDKYYEWTVTDYVKAQLYIDSVISICIEDLTVSGEYIKFNSREASGNRPELVITSTKDTTVIYSESILKKPSINVYPNPVDTFLSIEISDEVSLLKIVSHDGRLVYSQSTVTNDLQIDVSHLLSGLYLIVADNYVGKFVKI